MTISTHLRPDQVEWIGYSFEDPNMRTFRYNNKYFRAVQPTAVAWEQRVLDQNFLDRLASLGLIPETRPCGLTMEGFGRVYAQETEYFNVPMTHWSCSMLKEAARVFLDLNKELLHRSLRCVDGHCYNFVIQGPTQPKWCDLGSFIPLRSMSEVSDLDQFVRCCIYPLLLRQKSPFLDGLMRMTVPAGIEHEAAHELLGAVLVPRPPRDQALQHLSAILESITFTWKNTLWSNYHENSMHTGNVRDTNLKPGQYNRDKMVARLIKTLNPATVVDLGANAGVFSRMAAQINAEVLAIDPDETAVERHYQYLREIKETRPIKLMVGGVDGVRYQPADLALALALTHHLFFTARYPWKLIVTCLARHTSKSLITEFMPHGLSGVKKPDHLPDHYRLECLVEQLQRHFERVEVLEYPTPASCAPRTLILCTRKRIQPLDDGKGMMP